MKLIDGKKIASEIRARVKQDVALLPSTPGLAAILVGSDPASKLYVSLKEKACTEAGIHFEKFEFDAVTPPEKIIAKIQALNARPEIHAILLQLPLPAGFNENAIVGAIAPKKDVDGFGPGAGLVIPPPIAAVIRLIETTNLPLQHKKTAILANSDLFKQAMSNELVRHGLAVTSALAETVVIVTATGRPASLRAEDVPLSEIIIDVGSPRGDADLASFQNRDIWITPVPGGVGPMTVACLLQNVVTLARLAQKANNL